MPSFSCPLPVSDYPQVTLAHGGGGKLTQELVEGIFRAAYDSEGLRQQHDGAVLDLAGKRLAFTTDSHVVHPLFFPGGDIGSLAVNGTANDLAMCGARPLYLSVAFILEEGLAVEELRRVAQSMREAARAAGVQIVTGDTKVVDRGKGDGLFINTAGIGVIEHGLTIAPSSVRPGDAILLSGDVGRHGIAVMSAREGLGFESEVASDCACVSALVQKLLAAGVEIHCLRDATRGGLATALIEIARSARVNCELEERAIPVCDGVRAACEILGLDPLYVACEGRFAAFVAEKDAVRALEIMRADPLGGGAARIGRVAEASEKGALVLKTGIGASRRLEMLSGEQLPRIC